MRAIRVESYGGPEVLRIAEVPTPEPGAGQVRVKLAAAGVNFIDTYHRTGAYKGTLPFVPGGEGAGVVDAVGPGVPEFRPGDRVASPTMNGTYAEYALAAADRLVPVPQGVDLRVAAAALLQGCTAHYLSYSTFPLDPGKTALVHAAAGGVGRLLTQIATQLRARGLAPAGRGEKAAPAPPPGAGARIEFPREDFGGENRKPTGGVGGGVG